MIGEDEQSGSDAKGGGSITPSSPPTITENPGQGEQFDTDTETTDRSNPAQPSELTEIHDRLASTRHQLLAHEDELERLAWESEERGSEIKQLQESLTAYRERLGALEEQQETEAIVEILSDPESISEQTAMSEYLEEEYDLEPDDIARLESFLEDSITYQQKALQIDRKNQTLESVGVTAIGVGLLTATIPIWYYFDGVSEMTNIIVLVSALSAGIGLTIAGIAGLRQ